MTDALIDQTNGDTLTERAVSLIEADIVRGKIPPGARLTIGDLANQYGIGVTPVREGLSRLVARGLIVASSQRGFRVTETSRADLEDITRIRTVVECEALRLSMKLGGGEWEAGIVAALHQLRRHVRKDAATVREVSAEFNNLHKAFHRSLIAACGSPRMLRAHSDLFDQAYRYRCLWFGSVDDPQEFIKVHETLADLTIARRTREATAELAAHFASTLSTVYPDEGKPEKRG